MAMVTATAASLCFYGIAQYLFFFENLVLFLRQHGLDYAITDRVNSRFITPNVFASFLNLAWPMSLALLLTTGRRVSKWIWGAALALEMVSLYLTQSRGGWAVSVMVAATIVLLVPRGVWRGRLAVIVAVLAVVSVACLVLSFHSPLGGEEYADVNGSASGSQYSGLDITAAAGSMRGRTGIWRGGLDMFGDNILGGVGLGGFGVAMQRYQHRAFFSVHAHNYLLETAAELGIAGLAILLLVTALLLSRIRGVLATRRSGPEGVFAVVLWALCSGFLVHNLVDISWFSPLCAAVFWTSAGALFSSVEGEVPARVEGVCGKRGVSGVTREGQEDGSGERVASGMACGEEGCGGPMISQAEERRLGEQDGGTAERGMRGSGPSGVGEMGLRRAVFLSASLLAFTLVAVAGYFNARFFLSLSARDRADEADFMGEEQLAVEEYERALRFWEADPGTHQQMGYVLQGMLVYGWGEEGREDEYAEGSLYHLDRAIALESQNAYSHLWKGTLLLNLGWHEDGRAALREAERLYPNNPAPTFFEGESFFAQGEYEAALESYARTLRLTPYYADVNIVPFRGRPEFRYLLDAVRRSMEIFLFQGRGEEALRVVDDTLFCLPDNPTLHYYRAYVLVQLGEVDRALDELDRVEELLPGCTGVHLMKGKVYERTGDLARAREEYLRELEMNPESAEARERLDALERGGSPGGGG
ncbi:MAG: O-antigen ligase family protein [Actinobacteria bacterium]|nr:O-antigen ligase family protein [Actinomycetota bacterium]